MWQQTLAAHDLRLQFLKPIPPIGSAGRGAALVSHAATWRVLGRFDDWARVWAACAESGPVCAIEGISVVATQQPGEVQIDAVMRVWMRSAEGAPSDELTLADWMADMRRGARPPTRSHTALFAPSHSSVAELNTARSDALVSPTRIEGLSVAETGFSALSDDPKQWPLARIRLVGLWQAGDVRQAVVSAGPHTVRLTLGQSISLEGHRVVAITDQGVHLRSGIGPTLELPWAQVLQVGGSGGLSAGNAAGPPIPSINLSSTTGSSNQ
jgi:Tfp pilus assembly protein PilP